MINRKIVFGFVTMLCLFLLGTSFVLANKDNMISNFFKSKQEKLAQIKTDDLVAEVNGFPITYKDYLAYRENLSFVHEMNQVSFKLKPKEILEQMIVFRLIIQAAEEAGITVTEVEVKEYALEIQKAVEESDDAVMQKIVVERAKELGVDPSDMYTHPEVLKDYRENLIFTEFIDHLYKKDELNGHYTYDNYVVDILKENKAGIKVYQEVLLKK